MFQSVQQSRSDRATWLVEEAHKYQRTDALETLPLRFAGIMLPRFLDTEAALNMASVKIVGAGRTQALLILC